MIFLSHRWDTLVPRRVYVYIIYLYIRIYIYVYIYVYIYIQILGLHSPVSASSQPHGDGVVLSVKLAYSYFYAYRYFRCPRKLSNDACTLVEIAQIKDLEMIWKIWNWGMVCLSGDPSWSEKIHQDIPVYLTWVVIISPRLVGLYTGLYYPDI